MNFFVGDGDGFNLAVDCGDGMGAGGVDGICVGKGVGVAVSIGAGNDEIDGVGTTEGI